MEKRNESRIGRILYGTSNPAKLDVMRKCLGSLDIEIIGLSDLKMPIPEVAEDGDTPLKNAKKKALTYYKAFHMPVFSCDSGLYIENIPEELQPGVHVRRVEGKYLTDDEMIEYYTGLAKKYGDLTARYRNAICLFVDEETVYEAMEESMAGEPFIITSIPYFLQRGAQLDVGCPEGIPYFLQRGAHIQKKGFPLDSISVDRKTGKYFYELDASNEDYLAVGDGFRQFFKRCLGE